MDNQAHPGIDLRKAAKACADLHPHSNAYAATADSLVERIAALGESILAVDDPFDLFKLGLKCDDLSPSLFQAQWALAKAKGILEAQAK